MQFRILITILLISGLGQFLQAKDKRPAWTDTPPTAPQFFHGIGFADETGSPEEDRRRADEGARREIVQEISSTIQSEVRSFYEETAVNGAVEETTSTETFTSITSQYASETIAGIKIKERYFDKNQGIYYSYATLSRADFEAQLRKRAMATVRFCQDAYRLATAAEERGELYPALNTLSKALGELLVSQAFLKQKLEADLEGKGRSEALQLRIQSEIMRLMSEINFEIISGNDQSGQRNRGLSEALKGRFTDGQGNGLANIPLSIEMVGAQGLTGDGNTTDANGAFSIYIQNIESAKLARPSIRVRMAIPELEPFRAQVPYAFEVLDRKGPEFHFQIDVAASVKIFVRVLEEINGEIQQRSSTDGKLIKALIQEDYTILDTRRIAREVSTEDLDFSILYEDYAGISKSLAPHADYAIIGLISSSDSGSSSGVLFYARADSRVVVLDLDNGQLLANSARQQIKGAGNSSPRANLTAVKTCSDGTVADILEGLNTALE